MTISEMIAELQESLKEHGDVPVIFSVDDEMNYISSPNICEVNSERDTICAIGIFPSWTELWIDEDGNICKEHEK